LVARGAALARFARFLGGTSSSSGDGVAAVDVDVVVAVVAVVWSGSNTSLGSTIEGGATLLFLGGRPRRLGAGAGVEADEAAGVGVGGSTVAVLRLPDVRRGLGAGAGVKSSPLSSATWGASGVSSSEESTIAVRRAAARRVGRVDMAMGI